MNYAVTNIQTLEEVLWILGLKKTFKKLAKKTLKNESFKKKINAETCDIKKFKNYFMANKNSQLIIIKPLRRLSKPWV